ncbi:MAG: hypothetical protein Q8L78_01135 [Coxiellaceae bacterium]|nr:hypothetical protein [Coxiellaceae bacterium]
MRRIHGDVDPDVIGLSIDYDGSASPNLNSGDNEPPSDALLHFAYELLTDTKAVLWVYNGSLRNTRYINAINWKGNNNGCCFQHLIRFVETFQKKYPAFSHRIKLIKLTAEDIALNVYEGACFDNAINMSEAEKKHLAQLCPSPTIPWLDETKNALLYLQLHHLRSQSKQPLLIFTDDRLDILESLQQLFSITHPDWLPFDTYFQLIQFENREFSDLTFPLMQGAGIIDSHFKKTVQSLHHYPQVELTRHQKKTALELLPVLKNPIFLYPHLLTRYSFDDLITAVSTNVDAKEDCFSMLLHLSIEKNALLIAEKILQNPLNLSFLYKDQTPIEAAAKKEAWNIVELISQQAPDKNDAARYGIALLLASEAHKATLAIRLAKILEPAQRFFYKNCNGYSAFFFAARAQHDDLLHALLANQDPTNKDFIATHQNIFQLACHQDNIKTVQIISPYSNSIEQDLLHANLREKWPIVEAILDASCHQETTLTLNTTISLLNSTLQAKQFSIVKQLLLRCDALSEKEKNCLSLLIAHIEDIYNNTAQHSFTKTLLEKTLCLIKNSFNIKNTGIVMLSEFYRQITAIEGEALDKKMLHAFFVIAFKALTTIENGISLIITTLVYTGLIFTQESSAALDEIDLLLDSEKNSWDSIILLLHEHYIDYATILFGNPNIIDANEAAQFILSRLPDNKPETVDLRYIHNTIQKISQNPVKNSIHLVLIDSHFQQHALRDNNLCIAAHRALRLIFINNALSDPTQYREALDYFGAAKTLTDSGKTNQEVLDEIDILHKTQYGSLFSGPTSYTQLTHKLRAICPPPALLCSLS